MIFVKLNLKEMDTYAHTERCPRMFTAVKFTATKKQ